MTYVRYQLQILNCHCSTNFQPGLLPEMTTICDALEISRSIVSYDLRGSVEDMFRMYKKRRIQALEVFNAGRPAQADDIVSLLLSTKSWQGEHLLRLQRAVDYFVSTFAASFKVGSNTGGMFDCSLPPAASSKNMISHFVDHPDPSKPLKLISKNELRRIYRACYRIEIFHVVYQAQQKEQNEDPEYYDPHLTPYIYDFEWVRLFRLALRPWELEEMVCIEKSLASHYVTVCERLASDLKVDYQWNDGSLKMVSINDYRVRSKMVVYWIHRGFCTFPYLDQYSQKLKEDRHAPRQWVTARSRLDMTIVSVFSKGRKDAQGAHRRENLWMLELECLPLPFKGDDDIEGPNAMWVEVNKGLDQRYLCMDEAKDLRHWGYVFWDRSRLESWGCLGTSGE
ncbi:uncharacterized protein KY384_009270 [Bacidia gigantensis]|uniref:uncharacterized protein n=1 Tax=Bacidia gigantensis TaxID=2732470 RepID=UPI001D036A94|nr:uncharacterized protein KY384_009270 [Bacidia gigantensis]KAG8525626.1 hypothetical protein KY384_009270 [Bacidia gigantensis]